MLGEKRRSPSRGNNRTEHSQEATAWRHAPHAPRRCEIAIIRSLGGPSTFSKTTLPSSGCDWFSARSPVKALQNSHKLRCRQSIDCPNRRRMTPTRGRSQIPGGALSRTFWISLAISPISWAWGSGRSSNVPGMRAIVLERSSNR